MTGEMIGGERERGSRRGWLVVAIALLGFLIAVQPNRAEAQIGCCYCDNCPTEVGPFCTDLMSSMESCGDFCLVQRGCTALEFSAQETCAQGCANKPPFFSPTPTSTPTETATSSPTISATPTITGTPTSTETPVYCCQGNGGTDRCGIASPSNQPMCLTDEVPVLNAACAGGLCRTFTPTPTPTNTVPTRTPTPSATQTPTRTQTPTATATGTVGGFDVNPFSCYRITSESSAAKNIEYTVIDDLGVREKKILKPRYFCAPSDVEFDDVTGIPNNREEFLTCYKIKDSPKGSSASVSARNWLDKVPLAMKTIKGDLLCIPSFATVPTKPPGSPTASPSPAPTNTPS
jgi:hypothetical protein